MRVVVVGGGTAGAAAARAIALRGMNVVLLERGLLADAGARWVNGVPLWCFDEGGVPRPVAPELRGPEGRFHLIVGWGPERVVVGDRDTGTVDMRHLVARLQADARAAGAELREKVTVRGWVTDGVLDTTAGPVPCDVVVDAAGLGGSDLAWTPEVSRDDLCAAAQAVHRVADRAGASAWAAKAGVKEGEFACFTGIAGGYSIVNVHWSGDEVGVLTGSVPADGVPSGKKLLDDFVKDNPWIGERLFGGQRAVPLRPPQLRLATGRVARIGDAACQVYGAHGSGIGAQMIAAKLLADALADGRGPVGYERAWQRRWGGEFAWSALFAAFSRTITVDEIRRLVGAGIISPWTTHATLEQRDPGAPPLREIAGLVRGLARERKVVRKLLPTVGRMVLSRAVWRVHRPSRVWDEVARWATGGAV